MTIKEPIEISIDEWTGNNAFGLAFQISQLIKSEKTVEDMLRCIMSSIRAWEVKRQELIK